MPVAAMAAVTLFGYESAEEAAKDAVRLREQRKYYESSQAYGEAANLETNLVRKIGYLGSQATYLDWTKERGHVPEVVEKIVALKREQLKEAKDDKTRADILMNIADRYGKAPDKALAALGEVLALKEIQSGTKSSALAKRAAILIGKKDLEAAKQALADLKAVAPDKTLSERQQKERILDAEGQLATAEKDWNRVFDCYFQIVTMSDSKKPVIFPGKGFNAAVELMRAGKCAEARAMLDRVRTLNLDYRSVLEAMDIEGRTYKVEKNFDAAWNLFKRTLEDKAFQEKGDLGGLVRKATATLKELKPAYAGVFAFYDMIFADPAKYGFGDQKKLGGLLVSYSESSWHAMNVDRMRDAKRRILAHGGDLGKTGMFESLLRHYDSMANFPEVDKEKTIPATPKDLLGFDPGRKVVHAKDFGWNPTNATECLAKAFAAEGATTVVVDAMPGPWYVWNVQMDAERCSNRRIVFAKGCTVLSAPETKEKDAPGWYRRNMFDMNNVSNVWFEGEGELGKDVYIGKYRNRAERLRAGFEYGGNGFAGAGCERVMIKNLWIANCGQDALAWGGRNSFVVDCLFDDNYRQGMSLGSAVNNVYKNVTFCNTFGGEPHCGIDFEPYYEIYSVPYQYFFDCRFYNNASKNLIFATSTYAPMTAYFKRCQFEAQRNGNIAIHARPGIYVNAGAKALSNIIFDECRIDGYSDGHANPIQILSTFLYDVTFRNCVINDKGKFGRDGDHKASPVHLYLDRAYCDGFYDKAGTVTFENVTVNGYEGVPFVEVTDTNGKVGVNTFRGKVNWNGKEVDLSTFAYLPPDRGLDESADVDLKALVAPAGTAAPWEQEFRFGYGHNYYQPLPKYTVLASGKKGAKAEFGVFYPDMVKAAHAAFVIGPDGARTDLGKMQKGENAVAFTFPSDGVYAFDFNVMASPSGWDEDEGARGFELKSVTGATVAWQGGRTREGRALQLNVGDDFPAYTGYFEVPGGKDCTIKLQGGGIEIRNAAGKVVKRVTKRDYSGSTCVQFKAEKDEIWSFTMLDASARIRFYAPLAGIWAEDPEWLPTYGGKLAFTRVKKANSSQAEMPKAKLFPLPVKGAIAKAIEEAAAKRLEFGQAGDLDKKYKASRYHYDWMEPAMQRPEDLAAMDAELAALEPLRKMRDMQKAAVRESEDLRRYVAFVQLYAPVLALDDAAAKSWVEDQQEPEDDDGFADKVNAAINRFGVEWLDDGIYYEDYAGILKLAPFISDRLEKLGLATN